MLQAGTKLAPYEVLSSLGAGGMGEVYRARDTKLNRDVALKIQPELFAADPDRLARFHREARSSQPQSPERRTDSRLEDSGATHAVVMKLVEGPTLADRVAQGRVPTPEALTIARR